MTKVKKKDSPSETDNSTTKPENLKNQRKKKKKKKYIFWKKINQVEKRANKETKVVIELPPKTSQEVSSNWKALQEVYLDNDFSWKTFFFFFGGVVVVLFVPF